jgi:hypothetical protein
MAAVNFSISPCQPQPASQINSIGYNAFSPVRIYPEVEHLRKSSLPFSGT